MNSYPSKRGKQKTASKMPALLVLVAVACIALELLLHHHACTGEDCIACLAAHVVQLVALVDSQVIAAMAWPLALLVFVTTCSSLSVPYAASIRQGRCVASPLAVETPITTKVKLLI